MDVQIKFALTKEKPGCDFGYDMLINMGFIPLFPLFKH